MKKNNKRGFTLAELLIVVAIIGVLTAIAIPVFTTQLEKSREATDLANLRSAYAEVMAAGLTNPEGTASKDVALVQQTDGWDTADAKIAGVALTNDVAKKGTTVTVSYNNGTVKIGDIDVTGTAVTVST